MSKKIANICRQGITCIKNADNPYFNSKYADLATVVEALRKPLEDEQLGYMFSISPWSVDETKSIWVVYLTVVDFETGEALITSSFPIQNIEPQKFGSAVTYAKRYLLTTTFNVIAEEDDDGNAAQDVKPSLPKKTPKPLMAADINKQVNDEIPTFFR